jgi:hypothetical protein
MLKSIRLDIDLDIYYYMHVFESRMFAVNGMS